MKYLGLFGLGLLFVACSGEEGGSDVDVNSDGISSIVDNTDPNTTTGDDKYENVASNDNEEDFGTTSIEFAEGTHHFGKVFYPSENLYTFKFINTGNTPLVISSATASCGCTIPNKPEEPIMPGEEGELDVIFRPKEGQVGTSVTKRITVTANTEPAETYLEISAEVMETL